MLLALLCRPLSDLVPAASLQEARALLGDCSANCIVTSVAAMLALPWMLLLLGLCVEKCSMWGAADLVNLHSMQQQSASSRIHHAELC